MSYVLENCQSRLMKYLTFIWCFITCFWYIVWAKDFGRNKFQNNEFLSVYNPVLDLGVGVMIVWMLDLLDELDQLRPIQNFRPNQVPTLFGLLLQRNSFFFEICIYRSLWPILYSVIIFFQKVNLGICVDRAGANSLWACDMA